MWPFTVHWQQLRFGVEFEFVEGDPTAVSLLPGWIMSFDEHQVDETGRDSGSELKPPPMSWQEREQIREMLARLRATGAEANWSCGLHVHVGLEPWGQVIVPPLLDAALRCQGALQSLLQTSQHRLIYCPPVIPAMLTAFGSDPGHEALVFRGRPQSHRTGVNTAAWFDIGTVEIRYANASLDYDEVMRTVELCLRFVAAVGAGRQLPARAIELVAALGAPTHGYPPPTPAPLWHHERMWLEELFIPLLDPLVQREVPGGEILHIRPTATGFRVSVDQPDDRIVDFMCRHTGAGWELHPM